MIRALLRKELREHWLAIGVLVLLSGAGCAMIAAVQHHFGNAANAFAPLTVSLTLFAPLLALALGRILVAKEYTGGTQLFLEALPVSRLAMVSVKFCLGLAVLFGVGAAVFSLSALAVWAQGMMTPGLLEIVAARVAMFLFFAHCVCFAAGFLGRYAIPAVLGLLIAWMLLGSMTDFELRRTPPLRLVDRSLAYESDDFPARDLAFTGALCVGCLALTTALALAREGSVAGALAQRMSYREKVFVGAMAVAFLFAFFFYEEKKQQAPFDLPGAIGLEAPGVSLRFDPAKQDEAARAFAARMRDELAAVRGYLGIEEMPRVFISVRGDLDAGKYEVGELKQRDALLVRVNYRGPGWDERDFTRWLVGEVVAKHHPSPEAERWVLDGFGSYWMDRAQATASPHTQLRALYGTREALTADDFSRWLTYREKVGDDIASAVGGSVLRVLARRQGAERCQAFLRRMLGAPLPADARALARSWRWPVARALRADAGITFDELLSAWHAELAAARGERAEDLARIPDLRGELRIEPISTESRAVHYALTLVPAPPAGTPWHFLHSQLPPLDAEVPIEKITTETHFYADEQTHELPGSFSPGTRLRWTFAVEEPLLGCRIISGWNRDTFP